MELGLYTASGDEGKGGVSVDDGTFNVPYNEALVHQVVTAYLSGARSGTRAQKSRSQTRGGGAKPWRQKGTGRARAGSIRSPIWRGGGVTFAAKPTDYSQKVNKKMYRAALRSILSELVRQQRVVVVEDFGVDQPKTRELTNKLRALGLDDVLLVMENIEDNLLLAARNLRSVGVCTSAQIDPVTLVAYDKVLVDVSALRRIETRLA